MSSTPEKFKSFEEWVGANPYIPAHTEDEANHMSWRCGGGPHVQQQDNPHYATHAPEDSPIDEQPDWILKIIPGSVNSFREPAERYRTDTEEGVWRSFREEVRRIRADRAQYDLPEPSSADTNTEVKVITLIPLNEVDN